MLNVVILLRNAWAWLLDYLFVSRWQLHHLFSQKVPARYVRGSLAPVLLLPGVYETWQFLRPVADRLNREGHPVHVVAELGYNRANIPQAAALVERYLSRHDLREVILVAHSKGGLIGKHLMAVDDVDGRADRLIAVNTPFGGSRYARYLPIRTIRAFSPSEPTIAMLSGRLEQNARVTSIFSVFDPHIPGGSALDGAKNIPLPLLGHFRPLGDPLLIDTVAREVSARDESTLEE